MMVPADHGVASTSRTLDATAFLAQNERPADLVDVELGTLSPYLRMLMCHDGTLTTALEAHQLNPVGVELCAQEPVRLGTRSARLLRAASGTEAISRQVAIRERSTTRVLVRADSLLLIDRLPESFIETLTLSDKGLGGVLARMEMETRRELLWYGRTDDTDHPAVVRCYRIIAARRPALLVVESFPLDRAVEGDG